MEPERITGDNALERGLHALERYNDPELVDAYQRYMQRLEELIGRDQLDTYTNVYQRGERAHEQEGIDTTLTPEERAVYVKVAADPDVRQRYDTYLALAQAHGVADLDEPER